MAKKRAQLVLTTPADEMPALDTDSVSKYTEENIGQLVARAVQAYFERPGVREAYEIWKAEKAKQGVYY